MSKDEKLTYDRKTGKKYDAYKQNREAAELKAKKAALRKKFEAGKKDIDDTLRKSLHERINRAETEDEVKSAERRLNLLKK